MKSNNMSPADIPGDGRWGDVGTARSYVDIVYAVVPETIASELRVPPRELSARDAMFAPPIN